VEEPDIDLPKVAREAAYTAIGLGILAVRAGEMTRRRLGIPLDPISTVNGLVRAIFDRSQPPAERD
jgi:hypothetical protein